MRPPKRDSSESTELGVTANGGNSLHVVNQEDDETNMGGKDSFFRRPASRPRLSAASLAGDDPPKASPKRCCISAHMPRPRLSLFKGLLVQTATIHKLNISGIPV